MQGEGEAARAALDRSLAIAQARADTGAQMGLLGILNMFYLRAGEFGAALDYAKQGASVADPAAKAFASCMLGRGLFLAGELGGARTALEASLQHWPPSTMYFAADRHYRAGVALARTLFMQGFPAQAMARAHQAIEEVRTHPVARTGALAWVIGVFLWTGDLASAALHTQSFVAEAESHSLGPNAAVGPGLRGQLAICAGDAAGGVALLQDSVRRLREARYGLLSTDFDISLAQGLAATGRAEEAAALIEATIRRVEAKGDIVYLPELLRVQAGLLPASDAAEVRLRRALVLSGEQGARAWELRAATDLAAMLAAQGREESARAVLRPAFERFTEGFDTADLQRAGSLLTSFD